MLVKLSKRLTSFFILKNSINEDERESYDYCFEMMLSTVMNLISLIVIGLISGKYFETMTFAIVFMSLRSCGGGFHANTHFGCLSSLLLIFISMLILTYLKVQVLAMISIPVFGVAMFISFLLAPVDCNNKRISQGEKSKFKVKLVIINCVLILGYSVFMIFETTKVIAFCVAYTSFGVSMLFLIGTIKNKIDKNYEK